MFKDYLQLVRIPGIFTALSNVMIGYFFSLSETGVVSFPFLFLTSGMLFCSGMIFNDYFDLQIDKKERPDRPLPTKKISKQNALLLGVIFLILANFFAYVVGYYSLIISLIMTILIISYNYKLKFISFLGIFNLSFIRFLNILLGFSILSITFDVIQYAIPIGIFVGGISILAKNESDLIKPIYKKLNNIFILITIGSVSVLLINNFQIESLIFLGLFSIMQLYALFEKKIQNQITLQLLSIILLDAILISILVSFYASILVSLLIIPAYFIAKKLYFT
mgnify:CR=1 FL=1|jgi:hypothetical protein